MFILNQTNDDCIEIHRIKMCKHYNDDITKKINNIRSKIVIMHIIMDLLKMR